jgi:hypothetical protein
MRHIYRTTKEKQRGSASSPARTPEFPRWERDERQPKVPFSVGCCDDQNA